MKYYLVKINRRQGEQTASPQNNVHESQKQSYAKEKKKTTKEFKLYGFIYMKFKPMQSMMI